MALSDKDIFQDLIDNNKTDLYWVKPNNLYVLDPGELPESAKDWFFVIYTSRTGSTVLTELLNFHDDILCTSENNILTNFNAMLRSNFIYTPDCRINWRTKEPHVINAKDYREIMETWRTIKLRHSKPGAKIFGDKSWIYTDKYESGSCLEMCKNIFPECKWVMTYRENILDQISSLINQRWYKLQKDKDGALNQIYDEVIYTLETNDYIKENATVGVKFENMVTIDGFEEEMIPVLEYLEADPKKYPWVKAFSRCNHKYSIGRWQKDPLMIDFVKKYPQLAERIGVNI